MDIADKTASGRERGQDVDSSSTPGNTRNPENATASRAQLPLENTSDPDCVPSPAAKQQGQNTPEGNSPGTQQPAAAVQPVTPTASVARLGKRHVFVLISFVLAVLLPLAVCAWYLYAVAADQFASYVGFSVRTEEKNSAIELLGGITELSGSSSSDTDILFAYLTSQEIVRKADNSLDIRAIWSRVPVSDDPVFSFDPSGTIEDLVRHWERQVSITYDNSTGMIDLRILAFNPEDARKIASFLLQECSEMINDLATVAREDAIKYARDELEALVDRLKTARRNVTEFRNRHQIVDPTIDTQNQMGLLITLQQQLAGALIDVDLLKETTREQDPRIQQAQRRVAVIEDRIEAERLKLGIGSTTNEGEVFADIVGEYESLVVERQFAEEAYTSALAAYDAARAEARRKSRYLAAHVRPTLAERAEYPERGIMLAIVGLTLIIAWSIGILLYYSLRDRR